MWREQSESDVSPVLESEDGRLARICGGALSLSRCVGPLCRLLFPITGVHPSFSSQMNFTLWTSSFCWYSIAAHSLRSTACSTDSLPYSLWSASAGEHNEGLLSLWSAGWSSTTGAEDEAECWEAWGHVQSVLRIIHAQCSKKSIPRILKYQRLLTLNLKLGAYIHGMQINTWNILVAYNFVRWISRDILILGIYVFLANSCLMFVPFLEPEI